MDEYGWKQVSGDVFRPPRKNKMLLSVVLGTGIQLCMMLYLTLFFGIFGFMNPEKRTNILNLGLLLFCFMGLPGGFISASMYRNMGGYNWVGSSLLTAVLFPGVIFCGFLVINFILAIEKSSSSVKAYDIISLFFLWIFCTFPLILIGSFLGVKTKKVRYPCKVNSVPSIIPEKPWYLHYKFLSLFTGMVCFSTIVVEFGYAMFSLWGHEIYFLGIFLWLGFGVFVIVTGEVSILTVYWNLCYGDYNWWWKSFIVGSSPVIYFVLFSVFYFFYLKIATISAMVVYFGMMALISAMVMLICGSTSVLITLSFLIKIYGSIKDD